MLLFRCCKKKSAPLFDYDTIPLKIFVEIANGGNLFKLCVSRKTAPVEVLIAAWEEIVKQNSKANNSLDYTRAVNTIRSYSKILLEYNILKTACIALAIPEKKIGLSQRQRELIALIRQRGHTFAYKNSMEFEDAILGIDNKANGLITRLMMKEKELAAMLVEKNISSCDELLARLNVALGFVVPDDITLARYNEYLKIIKEKKPKP